MTSLPQRYAEVRRDTAALCEGLSAEDCQLQSMDDASPVKWHLAHTAWFFETFVLEPGLPGYATPDPAYKVLFNSYYVGVGARHPRPQRGLLSRPSLDAVWRYRRHVDQQMATLFAAGVAPALADRIELGLQHEQQHQELILTDLKHHLSCNPLLPAYRPAADAPAPARPSPLRFIDVEGGLVEIGHAGAGFSFDNEGPRHKAWLDGYALADRLVTQAEFQAFIDDGGYRTPTLWLSDGWDAVQRGDWRAPLYWRQADDGWRVYTLHGERALQPDAPACHLSYYEADAYARWAGARLPTEAEWEHAAQAAAHRLRQLDDHCWQWTASAYLPYPGFRPAEGAVGEYNGKFMVNQMVLRGGSCATPRSHLRTSYRNFFPPQARWQFSGLRLAR